MCPILLVLCYLAFVNAINISLYLGPTCHKKAFEVKEYTNFTNIGLTGTFGYFERSLSYYDTIHVKSMIGNAIFNYNCFNLGNECCTDPGSMLSYSLRSDLNDTNPIRLINSTNVLVDIEAGKCMVLDSSHSIIFEYSPENFGIIRFHLGKVCNGSAYIGAVHINQDSYVQLTEEGYISYLLSNKLWTGLIYHEHSCNASNLLHELRTFNTPYTIPGTNTTVTFTWQSNVINYSISNYASGMIQGNSCIGFTLENKDYSIKITKI